MLAGASLGFGLLVVSFGLVFALFGLVLIVWLLIRAGSTALPGFFVAALGAGITWMLMAAFLVYPNVELRENVLSGGLVAGVAGTLGAAIVLRSGFRQARSDASQQEL